MKRSIAFVSVCMCLTFVAVAEAQTFTLDQVLTYFSNPGRITLNWAFPSMTKFDPAIAPYGDLNISASAIEKSVGQTWSDPAVGQIVGPLGPYAVLLGSGFLPYSMQQQLNRGARLVELLSRRTGDLADVLAVERELARVRLEIERMDAETRATRQRVDLATVALTVQEQYRADLALGPLPLPVRFKNALVDGLRQASESLVGAAIVVLQIAPTLMVWMVILAWPARWAWRRVRA